MEVTLKPDNRKATVIEDISESMVKVLLDDGRTVPWPKSRINMPPKEGEETLKVIIIPAIDRLEELTNDRQRLIDCNIPIAPDKISNYTNLEHGLKTEAEQEFYKKWGLI